MPSDYNVGSATIKIGPSLRGFATKLREELKRELEQVKEDLDVAITADTTRFMEQVAAARSAVERGGPINIRLDLDTTRALDDAAAFRALASEDIDVDLDVDLAEARAEVESFRAMAERDINIDVDVNTVGATAKIAALRAEGNNDIDVRVRADTDDAQRSISSLRSGGMGGGLSIGMFSAATAAVSMLSAEIMGLVGAAGAAVTALGAVGATAAVGFTGVLGAFQAFKAQSDAAATSAGNSAQAQVSAANRVMDAQNQVAQSHERVRNSQTNLKNAQDKLNQSYRDASRDIRDMNNQLQSAELSQEASAIAVARAKERQSKVKADFRRGKASALDVQEANLDVKQSQQRLKESHATVKDQRVDTAEANRKGIGGSDKVRDARQGVDSAQADLAQAIYQQGAASRQLAEAQMAAANAGGAMATAQNKLDAALKKLSPNARDFVLKVRELGDEWRTLQQAVQERMFQGMGDQFSRVAKKQLPELQRGMTVLAGTVNGVMMDSMTRLDNLFTKFSSDGTFDKFLSSVNESFKGFAPFVEGAASAMTKMTIEAGPQIGDMFTKIGKAMDLMGPSLGSLGGAFAEHLGNLTLGFAGFMNQMGPTFEKMFPLVEQFLGSLGKVLIENKEPLERFVTAFANFVSKGLEAMSPFIGDILGFFTKVLEFVSGLDPATFKELILLFIGFKALSAGAGAIASASRMVTIYKSLGTTLLGVGKNAAGMAAGMTRGVQGLASAAKDYWAWTGKAKMANAGAGIKGAGTKAVDAVKGAGAKVVDVGQAAISGVGNLASKGAEAGKRVATSMTTAIKSGLASASGAISSGLTTALNASKGAANTAGTALKTGLAAGANAAKTSFAFLTALPGRIMASAAATKIAGAATKVWAGIQAAFNVVMRMNPIGLVITLIAALAAGIIYAYKNSETFRKVVDSVLNALSKGWDACWNAVKPILENLWDFIKKLGDIFTDVVNIFVSLFKGDFSGVFNGMRKLGEDVASAIGSAFKGIGNVMLTPFRALGGLLAGLPDKVLGISIPGVATIRSWGEKMQSVKLAEGGVVPAGVGSDGVLYGPGNGTSDSIQGIGSNGMPTAQVSAGEFVVNAESTKKNLGALQAINSGQKLAEGGVVGYGLAPGTGDTGKDGFPKWVQALGERFNVTPSTYANHQTSVMGDGGEAFGYRANPGNLNRGIDWGGSVQDMQKFAEYLMGMGPDSGLEQVIWQNPNTGQKLGRAGTRDVSGDDPYYNYDGGYNGHTDHVHTRFFQELQEAKPGDEKTDAPAEKKLDSGDNVGDGEEGAPKTEDAESANEYDTPPEDSSSDGSGFDASVFSVDGGLNKLGNVLGEAFFPKGSILNPGDKNPAAKYGMPAYKGITPPEVLGKGLSILGQGVLAFFGLENSILSSSNTYNQAIQKGAKDGFDTYGPKKKGKSKKKKSKDSDSVDSPNAGTGEPSDSKKVYGYDTPVESTDSGPTDAEIADAENALAKVKADRDNAEMDKMPLTPGATGTGKPKDMRSSEEFATAIQEAEQRLDSLKGERKKAQDAAAAAKANAAPQHTYDPSGGPEQWRPMVIAALKRNGFEGTRDEQDRMIKQIASESGGRPDAIQGVKDVNSANGDPAKGLLQVIGQTFKAYRDPSLPDDRTNPWSNMNAALRYYKATYGNDLSTNWGKGVGYATGGPVQGAGGPKDDAIKAYLSNGEYVINADATSKAPTAVAAINDDPNAAKAIEEHVTGGPQPLGPGGGGQGRSKSAVGAVAQGVKGWASNMMDQGQAVAGSAVSSAVSGVAAGAGGAAAGPAGFGVAQAAGAAKLGMDIGARFAEKFAGTLGGSLGFTGNEAKNMWTAFNSGAGLPGEEKTQGTAPVAKKAPDQPQQVDRSVNYGDVTVGSVPEFLAAQDRQEAQRNQAYFPGK